MSVERVPTAISETRIVPAVFGSAKVLNDPTWEWDFAAHLSVPIPHLNFSLSTPDIEAKKALLSPSFGA